MCWRTVGILTMNQDHVLEDSWYTDCESRSCAGGQLIYTDCEWRSCAGGQLVYWLWIKIMCWRDCRRKPQLIWDVDCWSDYSTDRCWKLTCIENEVNQQILLFPRPCKLYSAFTVYVCMCGLHLLCLISSIFCIYLVRLAPTKHKETMQ